MQLNHALMEKGFACGDGDVGASFRTLSREQPRSHTCQCMNPAALMRNFRLHRANLTGGPFPSQAMCQCLKTKRAGLWSPARQWDGGEARARLPG